MAQEANGLPYYSSNPTGVGAVYFGNNVDLLKLQQEQGEDLQQNIQQREQRNLAKKKLAYDMIGDPNVNLNGILSRDANDIRQQASKLQQSYATLLQQGADPSNPAFIDAYSKFNAEKEALKLAVAQSKSDNEVSKAWLNKIDPKKHDDASWRNMGTFLATPLNERGIYDRSKLVIPKKDDLNDLLNTYLKDVEPTVTSEEAKLPSGKTGIKTITEYTVPQVTGLAKAFLNSADKRESAERSYENLPDSEKRAYQQRAGATGDPLEIFVQDGIINRQPKQEKITGAGYSPLQREAAKLWGTKEKEKEDLDYLVERFGYVAGDDEAFSKEQPLPATEEENIRKKYPNLFSKTLVPTITVKNSGVLAGMNLGDTNIPIYENGAISKYQPVKNRHLYFAKIGNQLFAVTTKSQMMSEQGQGSIYVPVDDDYLDDLTAGASNPLRTKAMLKQSLVDKGLYSDGKIQVSDKSKQAAQPQGKTTTRAKIKALVGKKGYEGYTEQELIEYYKSQGYTIQ